MGKIYDDKRFNCCYFPKYIHMTNESNKSIWQRTIFEANWEGQTNDDLLTKAHFSTKLVISYVANGDFDSIFHLDI